MNKIDRLINIARLIKEEGVAGIGAGAPTNNASSVTSSGKPTIAGFPPDQPPVRKRPPIIARGRMPGSRTRWRQGLG